MTVVYFDLETTGLDVHRNEICQIAAVAIDDHGLEREAFEVKLNFDPQRADVVALEMNSFDLDVWANEAIPPARGIAMFQAFLHRHATVEMFSRRGKPYDVAQLAGHNIAGFDLPFIRKAFKSQALFMPAAFFGLDTLQLASWWRAYHPAGASLPKDLKLTTLAKWFGIEHHDAHDALWDVRANIGIGRALVEALGLHERTMPGG